MAAHQALPSLGFSRQEHWSGLPFPSPMHESDNWKWRRSVLSDSSRPYGLQPPRLLHPWDFPCKSTGVGWHCLLLSEKIIEIFNSELSLVLKTGKRNTEHDSELQAVLFFSKRGPSTFFQQIRWPLSKALGAEPPGKALGAAELLLQDSHHRGLGKQSFKPRKLVLKI